MSSGWRTGATSRPRVSPPPGRPRLQLHLRPGTVERERLPCLCRAERLLRLEPVGGRVGEFRGRRNSPLPSSRDGTLSFFTPRCGRCGVVPPPAFPAFPACAALPPKSLGLPPLAQPSNSRSIWSSHCFPARSTACGSGTCTAAAVWHGVGNQTHSYV